MDDRRAQRRDELRRRLADAPEGTLALLYELMDAAHDDFGTTTRKLFRQLCEESGISFELSQSITASEPASPEDRPSSPTPGQLRAMERAADDHYYFNLRKAVIQTWRDKVADIRQMNAQADSAYARSLARRTIQALRHHRGVNRELQKRLKMFMTWQDGLLVERCLRSWILRHRQNSLKRFRKQLTADSALQKWRQKTAALQEQEMRADDARDYMAASSALAVWRSKARYLQGLRKFKELYLQIKWFKIWQARTKQSSRARYDELLKSRYREVKQRLGVRSARRALDAWREKTAELREHERNADAHFARVQDERVRKTAHEALTSMYLQTAENLESERMADQHYEKNLVARFHILQVNGAWRGKVREIQAMEAKADEYREIRTQEVARDALRTIRNQASRTKQLETQADEFYDRHSKKRTQEYLHVWRAKAAEKQGVEDVSVMPPPPTTPAARRTALFRTVQH